MKNFQLEIKNKTKGVSLIETLVAIFVLTVGIVGAFSLSMNIISFTNYNSNKLIASYLAQEGVELVRNIRDSNWLDNDNNDALPSDGEYIVDYNSDLTNGSEDLYINDNGFYEHDNSPNETVFKRKIYVKDIGGLFLKITVTVTRVEKGNLRTVEVIERLYEWY